MCSVVVAVGCLGGMPGATPKNSEQIRIEDAMKRATQFMVEQVSCEGGYVSTYLPDMSRRWGELEARASMIWIQSPGTASMGDAFLNAFEATADEYYYEAASQVARILIRVQHPSGGWNYCADLAGEESLREWYATIGRNAWRLEEFHHYTGNATFDDGATAETARFLLRFHTIRGDEASRSALERAIQFVLDAQYPNGAWPQRHPPAPRLAEDGSPDYTVYCTFNDGVAAENIDFLLQCAEELDRPHLRDAARRGMDAFLLAQQPQPQAGWALQYTMDMQPAGARTYEPRALATHTTAENIRQLLRFHRITGDPRYLARIPEALDWLDAVKLSDDLRRVSGRTHPTFLEPGKDRPLYLHRSGSNVTNGRYFVDDDPAGTVGHYGSFRSIDMVGLRRAFEEVSRSEPSASSVRSVREVSTRDVENVLRSLRADGAWLAPLRWTSHPYRGDGPAEVTAGDFSQTHVGDAWDTSPFVSETPVEGISTRAYMEKMQVLIGRLRALR